MPRHSFDIISLTFPFLALPFELRLEIYRHAFFIYPLARTKSTHALLVPDTGDFTKSFKIKSFEILSYYKPSIVRSYRVEWPRYLPSGEQQRRGEHRYSCQSLLSLLLVSRAVYEEAMPLFYSETFFILGFDIWHAVCFLRGIGAARRKHVRHLSVEYFDAGIMQSVGGAPVMRKLVDQLVDAERVVTLEITLSFLSEGCLLKNIRQHPSHLSSSSGLESFLGFEQLDRLKLLGLLRLVGRWMAVLGTHEDILQRLERKTVEEGDGDGGSHRTAVEMVLPDG